MQFEGAGGLGAEETYRPQFARGLGAVTMSVCALVVVSFVLTGHPLRILQYGAQCALVALIAWMAFWTPFVRVTDGGVELRNVLRTVNVPWPALVRLDSRLGLRLVTDYGNFDAWAVPAPRRAVVRKQRRAAREDPDVDTEPRTDAGDLVERRWAALRSAGYLDGARLESPTADIRLHALEVFAVVLLLVTSVAVTLIGY